MKARSHAATDAQAASMLGIELITFRTWKASTDFDIRKTQAGWPMAALHNYAIKRKQRDKRNLSGEHSDRKGRKLDVEIEILELKRDEIKGELIALAESRQHCVAVAGIVRWAAEQWPAKVAVLTKDAAQVAQAEQMRDRILALCREKLEALE